jgi:hypothetical protein
LMAMRTVQRCWFLLGVLVEKLTFFHSQALAVRGESPACWQRGSAGQH